MFTASVKQKGIVDKAFLINVAYTNGSVAFNEVIDMTGGTLDAFSQRVQSRLDTLNATETLIPQVTLGAFTPTVATKTPLETFFVSLRHFNSCVRAVSLGLMMQTDQTYVDAQAALISAYDPSFLDSL